MTPFHVILGLFVGDAYGSQAEFMSPSEIKIRAQGKSPELVASQVFGTAYGQVTDDGEMAMAAYRATVGGYTPEKAAEEYVKWFVSEPFDVGQTCGRACDYGNRFKAVRKTAMEGMKYGANPDSQANGALMRLGGLVAGMYGSSNRAALQECAGLDAELTHPNPVTVWTNFLYAGAIHDALYGYTGVSIVERMLNSAYDNHVPASIVEAIKAGVMEKAPESFGEKSGWVLKALQHSVFCLYHHPYRQAMVQTMFEGGDTDTNCAIVGTLLGALHGNSYTGIPYLWAKAVINCNPVEGVTRHPRPAEFRTKDFLATYFPKELNYYV